MRTRLALIARAACIALLLAVAGTALAAPGAMTSRYLQESALVFRASVLKSGQLPLRVHLRNGPPVFSSQVTVACLGVPLQPDELVVYLAESGSCKALRDRTPATFDRAHGPEAARGLAQERAALELQLESSQLVIMQPQLEIAQPAALCYCPGNEPPVASVQSGSPQQTATGEAIATISFSASDADSPSLTHNFFYTVDGGLEQAGLPGGLVESCSAGSGTLSCNVTGSAPLVSGSYLIRFEAQDSTSSDSAMAELTVIDGEPPETVFSNGFEDG